MKKSDLPAILVSRCLLGDACRYAGDGCPHREVIALGERYRLVGICPEEDGGLPTPRPPAEICAGRVITAEGGDVTEEFKKGAALAVRKAKEAGATAAVLKARSPSCGRGAVYDGTFTHTVETPLGFHVSISCGRSLPVESANRRSPPFGLLKSA